MINKVYGMFFRFIGYILSFTYLTVLFILHPIEIIKNIKESRRIKKMCYRGCGKGYYYTNDMEVENGNTVL